MLVLGAQSQATVAIVLCTYNGARYIEEQLNSITDQSWPVAIRVFDDVSTDETVAILKQYEANHDLTISINRKNLGYVANFEAGIAAVIKEGFDYIALSDQDDIWSADKIEKGMRSLLATEHNVGNSESVLVHSDLRMIDANKQCLHASFFKYRNYELRNKRALEKILGQNGVMGNTVLINRAMATMALPFPEELHVHDYWLAVLAELYGHRVLIDEPLVDYRIHADNASNSSSNTKEGVSRLLENKSWQGFIKRDYRLPFKEDFRLKVVDTVMNPQRGLPVPDENQVHLLTIFRHYLVFDQSRIRLLKAMFSAGFFRQCLAHRARLSFSMLFTRRYD